MTTPSYTVAELTRRVFNVIDDAFADDVWVTGEISGLNRSRGHVYFDLLEPTEEPGQPAVALVPVMLFAMNKVAVNRTLTRHGVPRMNNGVHVRIRGQLTYTPRSGRLQLRMTGIDPAYTLGQIAVDRERVMRALRAEGLVDRNSRLAVPPVPLRIGLVTSKGSAAEADFLHELELSGFAFRVQAVDTRVQGVGAGEQVARALRRLEHTGVDLIALVRGGGSRADLGTFDSEHLARTIAGLSVPVLTGVGHEVDRSIADDVAHTAYKTPTACAAALVAAVRAYHDDVEATWADIAHLARAVGRDHHDLVHARARACAQLARGSLRGAAAGTDNVAARVSREVVHTLGRAEHRLDRRRDRAAGAARTHVARAESFVDRGSAVIRTRAPREITAAERQLVLTEARLRALDPTRLLARGWSITRATDGTLLRSTADAPPGATLTTRVVDGVVHSIVTAHDEASPPHG